MNRGVYYKILKNHFLSEESTFIYLCDKIGFNDYGDEITRMIYSLDGMPQNSCRFEICSATFDMNDKYEFKLIVESICVYAHRFKVTNLADFHKPFDELKEEIDEQTKVIRRNNKIDEIVK